MEDKKDRKIRSKKIKETRFKKYKKTRIQESRVGPRLEQGVSAEG